MIEALHATKFVGDGFKVDPALLKEPPAEYLIRERDPFFCEALSSRMDANPYAVTAPFLLMVKWGNYFLLSHPATNSNLMNQMTKSMALLIFRRLMKRAYIPLAVTTHAGC